MKDSDQRNFQCIIPQIYLGSLCSVRSARGRTNVDNHRITHMINLSRRIVKGLPSCVRFVHDIEVKDDEKQSIQEYFPVTNEFIHHLVRKSPLTKILIFCVGGVSRSATIVAAYLIQYHQMTPEAAIALLKKIRPCVSPNRGFVQQLRNLYTRTQHRLQVIYDMETQDPDDVLALLLLCHYHSMGQIILKGITLVPGSPSQVGVIQWILNHVNLQPRPLVGAYALGKEEKGSVSGWHYKVFGPIPQAADALDARQLLLTICNDQTVLITGGPLKNLGAILRQGQTFRVKRWVAQGGFAGEGVVPFELQLSKFKGLTTCSTYNLNGDIPSAHRALTSSQIPVRYFVSKNVCHRVVFDAKTRCLMTEKAWPSSSLKLFLQAMAHYKGDKKLHDPLAVACALDPSIGVWKEVELFSQKSNKGMEWGSRIVARATNTFILIDYDSEKFSNFLCGRSVIKT